MVTLKEMKRFDHIDLDLEPSDTGSCDTGPHVFYRVFLRQPLPTGVTKFIYLLIYMCIYCLTPMDSITIYPALSGRY